MSISHTSRLPARTIDIKSMLPKVRAQKVRGEEGGPWKSDHKGVVDGESDDEFERLKVRPEGPF